MVRNDEAEKSVKKGGTAFMTPFTDDKSVKGVLYSEVTKPSGREADIWFRPSVYEINPKATK